ncbi:MAG TPA: hypothetical protein VJA66_06770, partial [Thermoanaerobaculia bacterium]
TSDGAQTWSALNIQGTNIESIAVDPLNPSIVFEADYGGMSPSGGVFKTSDGGKTWTNLQTPLLRPSTVAIDPHNPSIIYAGAPLAKSEDGGSTWTLVEDAPTLALAILFDRENPPVLFAIGVPDDGILRTADGGKTWVSLNAGLSYQVYSLAVDPSGTYLYVGTLAAGVFDFEILTSREPPNVGEHRPIVRELEPRARTFQ